MKYRFEIPKHHHFDKAVACWIRGGMCPSHNTIYIYGYCNIPNAESEGDDFLYQMILEHEHLHSVLYKIGIPLKFHEQILIAMNDIRADKSN